MSSRDNPTSIDAPPDLEEQAAALFAQRRLNAWAPQDESRLQARLIQDAAFSDAFRRVEQGWRAAGEQATLPELMALRERAIARVRRSNSRRWSRHDRRARQAVRLAAGVAVLGIALTVAYRFAPFGWKPGEFRTRVAEQRVIELDDHSHVALDAATRLRVKYSADARLIQLLEGQAQFTVAQDPQRPFKVQAGHRTVVALGTKFTVEYIDRTFNLAMLEGRVAVIEDVRTGPPASKEVSSDAATIVAADERKAAQHAHPAVLELTAGEGLQVNRSGQSERIAHADLRTANAWREGKVIFNGESLAAAVARLNRYSRLRMEIEDPRLAAMRVSGVFDTGDTQAFIEAVEGSLPATADYSGSSIIRLRARAPL